VPSPPAEDAGLADRLDRYQRRHPVIGFPIAVVYKYFDDQGIYLAALMTYYAFIGAFPLLLIGSSVLGFLLQNDPTLQEQVLDSALSNFPVIGDQLGRPGGLEGSTSAIVVGLTLSLYGGVNVALAAQNAMNVAWSIPRNSRPNPFAARGRGLVLLITGGVGVLAVTAISVAASNADQLGANLGRELGWLVTVATVAVTAWVFVFIFRHATPRPLGRRDVLPGAILVGILWHVLQLGGSAFVGSVVANSSATNGVFALVLGLVAWLFLVSVTVVLCVEVNVVRVNRLYPRALLTPFTDMVDLTDADRRSYRASAAAQRTKDFAHIDVRFDHDGQWLSAQRRIRRREEVERQAELRAHERADEPPESAP
jgi:membrane protein